MAARCWLFLITSKQKLPLPYFNNKIGEVNQLKHCSSSKNFSDPTVHILQHKHLSVCNATKRLGLSAAILDSLEPFKLEEHFKLQKSEHLWTEVGSRLYMMDLNFCFFKGRMEMTKGQRDMPLSPWASHVRVCERIFAHESLIFATYQHREETNCARLSTHCSSSLSLYIYM